MTYSPHTDADRAAMLKAIGVASADDLFADIPASVRAGSWEVPTPLVEQDVRAELARIAGHNRIPEVSFLG
ncbi:MAG: glycine dehydrogenase, partial [Candidatus Limnocylindria bacterium]